VTDDRPSGTAKIEIRQLSVGYTGRQVVRGVDLAIPATSIYAWIGPAGGGKASILRTINLLSIKVDGAQVEGEIVLDGKDLLRSDEAA
jgi:phosphate transport system ATP-binding protein